jgi:hypothetical protein
MTRLPRLLIAAAVLWAPGLSLAAQTTDSDKADSALVIHRADSARATLVQPPGSKGYTPAGLVRAPFKLFGGALALVGGIGYAAYELLDETGTIRFAKRTDRAFREHGLKVRPRLIGHRSGPALVASWEGEAPFFLEGGISNRLYTLARGGVFVGDTMRGAEIAAGAYRMNQIHFWGVGPDSREEDGSDYAHFKNELVGHASFQAMPHLKMTVGGGWEQDEAARGHDDLAPDVLDTFADDLPFGSLGTQSYFRADASADLDFTWISGPNQTHGARLLADWSGFRGKTDSDPDFQFWSTDLRVYMPLNPRHAFVVRGLAADAFGEAKGGVPLYYLATLGSTEGLRGQKGWRLRDKAMLSGMAEYRYQVWWHPGDPTYRVEAFWFVDHGAVGSSLSAIDWNDFDTTPGIGVRFIHRADTQFETYLGFGGDKPRIGVKLGGTF